MQITHGTWGERIVLFESDSCLVTFLKLEPWKRCSWHHHKSQYNRFFVTEGELGVKTDKGYTSVLTRGQSMTVDPGVKHEFQTYSKETEIVEIAYTKRLEGDIIRESLGGDLDISGKGK